MSWKIMMLPVVGGIIGWITNLLAVKMLFRPYQGITLPWVNYTLQGLIPKRQKEIARLVGRVVEKELLGAEDIIRHLQKTELTGNLAQSAGKLVQERVMAKIPTFLPMSLRAVASEIIGDILKKEVPVLIDRLLDKMEEDILANLRFGEVVEEKIKGLDMRQMEALVLTVAARELKHIEYLGFILGFLIGCLQILFVI
ncbi:MAG: DUF445 family protein [Clostridia bacterium]|nr:DUF445 family protein [Clostridia bacterium]